MDRHQQSGGGMRFIPTRGRALREGRPQRPPTGVAQRPSSPLTGLARQVETPLSAPVRVIPLGVPPARLRCPSTPLGLMPVDEGPLETRRQQQALAHPKGNTPLDAAPSPWPHTRIPPPGSLPPRHLADAGEPPRPYEPTRKLPVDV